MILESTAVRTPTVRGRLCAALLLAGLTLVGIVGAAAWPTVAVILGLFVIVSVLAWRAPVAGFLVALLVSGGVGLLKARLGAEQMPSADTVGALIVDAFLVIGFIGLIAVDRGAAARRVWRAGRRPERIVWLLLLAWLVISVLQIPESGNLTRGIKGFRLTQAYVPLVLAGIALVPVARDRDRVVRALLVVFAVISGYATLRALIGPASWERSYALSRSGEAFLSGIFRTVGSFNTPQDMVSFIAPAGTFALIVGLLDERVRALALTTAVLAGIAVVESYVRTALVAVAVGAGAFALLVLLTKTTPRYLKLASVIGVLTMGGAGYAAALAAGGATQRTASRAAGLSHPLTDPSVEDRFHTWSRAVHVAVTHPIGTGLGTVGSATGNAGTLTHESTGTYTDNSYLKAADEQGIPIGLLFIVGLLGSCILVGRRVVLAGSPKDYLLAVAALGGIAAYLLLCFMGDYIEWPGKILAWTLLGIAVWDAYGRTERSATVTT